jgi:hypothetical protein
VATLVVAVATAALLAFLPTSSQSCTATSDTPEVCTTEHDTLYGTEGPTVLIPLGIPVAAALLPVASRRRGAALAAAVVINLLAVAGMMTIGLFFFPTVLLAWVSFARRTLRPPPGATP